MWVGQGKSETEETQDIGVATEERKQVRTKVQRQGKR